MEQGLEGMREEKLHIEIIYYIKHLDEIRTCQNILKSTDKLQPSAIRILCTGKNLVLPVTCTHMYMELQQ